MPKKQRFQKRRKKKKPKIEEKSAILSQLFPLENFDLSLSPRQPRNFPNLNLNQLTTQTYCSPPPRRNYAYRKMMHKTWILECSSSSYINVITPCTTDLQYTNTHILFPHLSIARCEATAKCIFNIKKGLLNEPSFLI